MHTIKPSLVPHMVHRKPFLTYETRPDPASKGRKITVAVVNLPTPSGDAAQIDLDDYNPIMERGFSDQMWMHSNGRVHSYLRTSHPEFQGKTFTVARLIVGAKEGTRVRLRNHNSLDLRQSNLQVGKGRSMGHEAAAMAETTEDEGEV